MNEKKLRNELIIFGIIQSITEPQQEPLQKCYCESKCKVSSEDKE